MGIVAVVVIRASGDGNVGNCRPWHVDIYRRPPRESSAIKHVLSAREVGESTLSSPAIEPFTQDCGEQLKQNDESGHRSD